MPRNYKRKTTRQDWDQESMKKAIESVIQGSFGYLKAAVTYGVPRSTLQDRVNKYRKCGDIDEAICKGLGRYKTVFTPSEEQSLVDYVLTMESRLFGLSYKDLRRLAFQFAEANKIQHNFNKTYELAGEEWLIGFMKRHPNLTLRAAEPTSVARAMGFNRVSVNKFYDLIDNLMDQYKFPPTKIFNVDETGITTVPKKQSKVISLKGKKQVGLASSAERGQLTTAVICVSASGNYVPPLLIFPRVRMKAELLDGSPPGTIAVGHPSGWIQSDLFVHWLDHFISYVKPKKDDPVLLVLDGHKTHTQNIPLIEKARKHGVVIVSLPPHCTHKLQPLDVSFMGPLSTFYAQEVNMWLRNNPGRVVTQFQLGKLFGASYCKAATIQTAVSGFSRTGIFPTNRNVFSEADFVAAETTDIEMSQNSSIPSVPQANITPSASTVQIQPRPSTSTAPIDPIPSTSTTPIDLAPLASTDQIDPAPSVPTVAVSLSPSIDATPVDYMHVFSSSPVNRALPTPVVTPVIRQSVSESPTLRLISPADIIPIPKISNDHKRKTNHRRGKTVIITSSPYKNELVEIENSRKRKPNLNLSQPNKTLKRKTINEKVKSNSENFCAYCKEEYGKSRLDDGWVQCLTCKCWSHESCTGLDLEDLDTFECLACIANR